MYNSEYQWIWDNMVQRNRDNVIKEILKEAKENLEQTRKVLTSGHDFGELTKILYDQEEQLIQLIGELGGWDEK